MNIELMNNEPLYQEAAEALGFPTYEDFWSYPTDDAANMAYIADKYGHDMAVKLIIAASLAGYLFTNFTSVAVAQNITQDKQGPPVEGVTELNLGEIVHASALESEENIYIYSLDAFKELIKTGISTKTYKLNFTSQDTYTEVENYISKNLMFFSTGEKMAPLDLELLHTIWGNKFNFIVINDSQPAQPINQIVKFATPLLAENTAPIEAISSTVTTELGRGLIKNETIITNTNGVISNTINYVAPWTYEASQTVTGAGLVSGRYGFLASPAILLVNSQNGTVSNPIILNILYTGGSFKDGDFIPSFEYEPVFKSSLGSSIYHGNAIGQNVIAETSNIDKMFIIGADPSGYHAYSKLENMFMMRFVELLDQANQVQGNKYNIIFTESIGGSTERHNMYANFWDYKGIKFRDFITTFGAAGNGNEPVLADTKYPGYVNQVVALRPDFKSLTYYSNYGFDENLYLGGRGDFLAYLPYLDGDGHFDFVLRSLNGTSMATPKDASFYANRAFQNDRALSISDVFTTTADVIYMGELAGGKLITNVATLSLPDLNNLLNMIPENGGVPSNSILQFDADWSRLNKRFYKNSYLSALDLNWDDYVAMSSYFNRASRDILFARYFVLSDSPRIYILNEEGRPLREINKFTNTLITQQINRLQLEGKLPDVPTSIFDVKQITQTLRVGSNILPDQNGITANTFIFNTNLIRENFDPNFGLAQSTQYLVFVPLAKNEN